MPDNKYAYVSPQIQRQMQQELQRTLPPNLKEYASGQTYIPQHAQKALLQHMEKTMPAHLKQYAGEFVRQQAVSGQMSFRNQPAPNFKPAAAPVTNRVRRDHSLGFGQQYTVDTDNPSPLAHNGSIAYTSQYQGQGSFPTPQTAAVPQPQMPQSVYSPGDQQPAADYNFILNHPTKPPHTFSPLGGSMAQRIAIVAGGAMALFLLAILFTSILSSSGSNTAPILAVAQKQTELSRVSSDTNLSTSAQATQDLASQIHFALLSDQQTLTGYFQQHGTTFDQKTLSGTANPATDKLLSDAKTNGNYDQTFVSVMTSQLTSYEASLQQAFKTANSGSEKQLLVLEYQHAQLLLTQAKHAE